MNMIRKIDKRIKKNEKRFTMDREVVDLYLDDIIPNRFQPREVFNGEALKELSDSIKAHGVIQPIIVRKIGDKYEIIAGERRYKASAMAGLTKIPAIIRNLDDKETSKVALLENLQRKDLTPIEEARTYQKILELDSMTQEELGRTMGKSQASIANKMRLLSLPDEVQEALLKDQISERHARSLLNLSSAEEQIAMLHEIIDKRMTVRELDTKIKGTPTRTMERPVVNEYIAENKEQVDTQTPNQIFNPNIVHQMSVENREATVGKIEMPNPMPTPISNKVESTITPLTSEPNNKEIDDDDDSTPSVFQVKPKKDLSHLITPKEQQNVIELLDDEELFSLRDAVAQIRNTVGKVREKGFIIKVEEMDFEKNYQIVIKIEKNM